MKSATEAKIQQRNKNNVIYKLYSKINGKFYIGSATYYSARKSQHKHHLLKGTHSNTKLQNHVNKYGFDDLVFLLIEKDCDSDCLIKKEQYYIDMLKPWFNIHIIAQSPKGLKRTEAQINNIISGRLKKSGYKTGFKHSDYSKSLMSKAHKGKKMSKDSRKKISIKNSGKIRSDNFKQNLSNLYTGRLLSDKTKLKISQKLKKNTNWKKVNYNCAIRNKIISDALSIPILQIKNDVIIKEWTSTTQAAKHLSLSRGNIWFCINGKRKTTGGFSWKIKEKKVLSSNK